MWLADFNLRQQSFKFSDEDIITFRDFLVKLIKAFNP